MTYSTSIKTADGLPDLSYKPALGRNIGSRILTIIAGLFAGIAVLPLILVLGYVLIRGASKISITLLTELPPPPGLEGGGESFQNLLSPRWSSNLTTIKSYNQYLT